MRREYIGYRDHAGDGGGRLYGTGLTFEEVVRCRDCKNAYDTGSEHMVCMRRLKYWATVRREDFCSWGKRREP